MNRILGTLILGIALLLPQGAHGEKAYGVEDVPNTYAQDRHHHVSDPEGILSAECTDEINSTLSLLEDSTGIQSMVVMLPGIGQEDIFEFAHSLFRHWGIGDKERDNGLLILYVGDQHAIRFTTGYGLEGILPDAVCKRIQQRHMIPYFREGDTDKGMSEGVTAVARTLRGSMENSTDDDVPELWQVLLAFAGAGLMMTFLIWLIVRHANTCPRCKKAGALKTVSSVSYRDALRRKHIKRTLHCSACGHTVVRDDIADNDGLNSAAGGALLGGGRGGFGGGGFSGGSFGGGSTGGGGATSRW